MGHEGVFAADGLLFCVGVTDVVVFDRKAPFLREGADDNVDDVTPGHPYRNTRLPTWTHTFAIDDCVNVGRHVRPKQMPRV